ncbi:MAG: DUF2956 domain-containing protein [Methylococcaceae bacterium]|nr:DUF2956 domain-containing protein [Methylococcaceae bacterium]
MSKSNKYQKISPQTQEDAIKAAKATQRPGQTKEQTKLIAQGIQKGIDHYKKQQKSRSRELNKKIHKLSRPEDTSTEKTEKITVENIIYKQSVLPWVLLIISWLGFVAYLFKGDFI